MKLRKPFDGDFRVSQVYWSGVNNPDNSWRNAKGERWNPYVPTAGHMGIDYATPGGTILRSPFEGTVQHFEDYPAGPGGKAGYGTNVEIYGTGDWWGYYCILAHGERGGFLSSGGDMVKAGDPVLISDDSGFSTAAHIHFGLRYVNPTQWTDAMRGWINPKDLFEDRPGPLLPPWALMTVDERKQFVEYVVQGLFDAVLPNLTALPASAQAKVESLRKELERFRGNL